MEKGIQFLEEMSPREVKSLSRAVQALHRWNRPVDELVENLASIPVSSVRDAARACSALSQVEHPEAPHLARRIRGAQMPDGSWNQDLYDTAYALIALANAGRSNEPGCTWIAREVDEHPYAGSTAMAITALTLQGQHPKIVGEKIPFLLERLPDYPHPGTKNLIMQALLLNDHTPPVEPLIELQNPDGSWGTGNRVISTTALSLITLWMISPSSP